MNFVEIKQQAISKWHELEQSCKSRILIGAGSCGRAAGALALIEVISAKLAENNIEAIITQVGCIGLCYAEPMIGIIKPGQPLIYYGNLTPKLASQLIDDYLRNDNPRSDLALGTIGEGTINGIPKFFELPMMKSQVRITLRNCGLLDPENINHYIASGGYSGFVKALAMTPEAVLAEVTKSGLRGRGGAGFSTAAKWESCRRSPGTVKYIICNADEGDPGAFMNRSLLEGDPHSVLEGMLIGAYAIGATKGYIYCRAEKPLAIERLRIAIRQANELGFTGENILGSGFSFSIELRAGAGAFVCGEATALVRSIEGKRGTPRSVPPRLAQSGLWGKPTLLNNVETWGDVSVIMQKGADWFAGYGSTKSKGTKTFALAGKIKRTGLIEVPMGIALKDIIFEIGGGILNDKRFKAVQTGGPSGGCIPVSLLDLPVDYESLAQAGSIMGSGGMVVMDENTCMVDVARYFLTFTQLESCGKCVMCRLGTKQMLEILKRICRGEGKPRDIDLLWDLSKQVQAGSRCGLGQAAPNPVLTTIRYFRDEYEAHIKEHRCPALACNDLVSFYIVADKCQGCGICLRGCPAQAIIGGKRMVHIVEQKKCVKCGTCLEVCPPRFSAVVKVSGEKVAVPSEPIPVIAKKVTDESSK
jgi:NADH-quinone oxidoreductase subunit F